MVGRERRRGALVGKQPALVRNPGCVQPLFEFGRWPFAHGGANLRDVVEGQGLIAQHDVVGTRNGDDKTGVRRRQKVQERVHIVAIRFGMVGVAHVATHLNAQKPAAEVVLQPGPDDLLTVVQVFGPDESHHRIDQQRTIHTRHPVRASLQSLLVNRSIDTYVCPRRQARSLTGLKIQSIRADGSSAQFVRGLLCFGQHTERHAEGPQRSFRSRN